MLARRRIRTNVAQLAVASLLGIVASSTPVSGAAPPRGFSPIPAAAYQRPLGDIPVATAAGVAGGRGAPLGGFGAGSFMLNQSGSLGPFELRSGTHEERILPQAAFHLREQLGSASPTVNTLAAPHPLGGLSPAFQAHQQSPGSGTYAALYPFAWMTFDHPRTDVSIRAFSPIIAGDERRTSLPVAYFDVSIVNNTSDAGRVDVMLTFPNAPLCVSTQAATAIPPPRPCTRTGLGSVVTDDSGVTAVSLTADSPTNTVDSQQSEWTIAARPQPGQTVSYATSWDSNGTGGDIMDAFQRGPLPNRALDASHSAGAITLGSSLAPGQRTELRFALAWDFPRVIFGDATGHTSHVTWMRRYTDFYGAAETQTNTYVAGSYPPFQAARIAKDALLDHDTALFRVRSWWDKIVDDSTYPPWLVRAALNEMYFDAFGESFWEGGLVESTLPCPSLEIGGPCSLVRIGAQLPGTHLYYTVEQVTGMFWAQSFNVRSYGEAPQFAALFPTIDRDVERAWTELILQDPRGHPPHDVGVVPDSSTSGATPIPGPAARADALIAFPYMAWGVGVQTTTFLDLPARYILDAYQYYVYSCRTACDNSFLAFAVPAMVRAYNYISLQVSPTKYLPFDIGIDNTYDSWPFLGQSSYIGGLWIAAQEALQASMQRLQTLGERTDQALLSTITQAIPHARLEYESLLWDPTPPHPHYRIDTESPEYGDGIMADALWGQHAAERLGLADVVGNISHVGQHLRSGYDLLLAPFNDALGQCTGLINGVNANGSRIQSAVAEAGEVWTGTSYFWAATAISDGRRLGDGTLVAEGLAAARCIERVTYEDASTGYAFATPEAWQPTDDHAPRAVQYMRPRASWEALVSLKDPFGPNSGTN